MISFELAKELKEKGFPQEEEYGGKSLEAYNSIGDLIDYDNCCDFWRSGDDYYYAYIPTLSELIEACGDKMGGISRNKKTKEWISYCATAASFHDVIIGKTPEEAVARLWLALQNNRP